MSKPGVSEDVLARVQKLLAKGEDAGSSEAEAAAFLAKAQELMLRHRLTREEVDAADVGAGPEPVDHEEVRDVTLSHRERRVGTILVNFFGVRLMYSRYDGKNRQKTHLTLVGLRQDVQVAQYVRVYLLRTFGKLWAGYLAAWQAEELERCEGAWARPSEASYYEGLAYGVSAKLAAARRRVEEELAVALREDPRVKERYDDLFPDKRPLGRKSTSLDDAEAGYAAGREIDIPTGLPEDEVRSKLKRLT